MYGLDLSEYIGQEVVISWEQRTSNNLEDDQDYFYYAFSGDGGISWSEDFEAFHGGGPSSPFSTTIPEEYVTDNFKVRFIVDFSYYNEYVYIDDITLSVSSGSSVGDARVNRVIFNGHEIVADPGECQTAPNPESGAPDSWSYSCFYDATDLVREIIDQSSSPLEPNGAGTYTLGHHQTNGSEYDLYGGGETDYPLATPAESGWGGYPTKYQWTYAGWSLILIYSSPETAGHQLYLFDDFHYVAVNTTLDFDISGFLVPEPIGGEENAAHITCFVGDGDHHYPGDFIALNPPEGVAHYNIPDSYKLWDGTETDSLNNAWNSQSLSLPSSASGVDIDTFEVSWDDGLLEPDDTTAKISLGNDSQYSLAELINVVYLIVSFRSDITSGGTISYLVW